MSDPERPRQDPVDAVRPGEAGRKRGRLIPAAIVVGILLIFAFIILVTQLVGK
jgi:hypothetical protein